MTKTDMPTKDYLAEMKRCTNCQRLKDTSEFYSSGGKLKAWCKPCWRAQVGGYRLEKKAGKSYIKPKSGTRKTCTKCKKRKALSKFNSSGSNRLHSWCKICQNAITCERQQQQRDKAKAVRDSVREVFEKEARGKATFEFVIGFTKFQCFPQDSEYQTMLTPLNNSDEAISIITPLEKLWALGDWIAKEKKARTE